MSKHYVKPRPCGCGCGQIARGEYKVGHRLLGHGKYRTVFGERLHRVRAVKALGRPLPKGAVVHHADGTTGDHAPLVICQNQSYHRLLHARMDIVRAGGDPNTHRICSRCKRLVPAEDMANPKARAFVVSSCCKSCNREIATMNRRRRGIPTREERYGSV